MFQNFVKQAQAAVNSVDNEIRSHLQQNPTETDKTTSNSTEKSSESTNQTSSSSSWAPSWNLDEAFTSLSKSAKDAVNSIPAPKIEVPDLYDLQKSISSIDVSSIGTSLSSGLQSAAAAVTSSGVEQPILVKKSSSRSNSPVKESRPSVEVNGNNVNKALEEEKAKSASLESQLNTLRLKAKTRIQQLQQELEDLKSKGSVTKSTEEVRKSMDDQVEQLRKKIGLLQEEKATVVSALQQELEQERSRGESIADALEADLAKLRQKIVELESRPTETVVEDEKLLELQQSLEAAKQSEEALKTRIAELETQLSKPVTISPEISQLQSKIAELEAQITKPSDAPDVFQLQARITELESQLAEKPKHTPSEDIEALKLKIQQLESRPIEAPAQSTEELDQAKAKISELEEKVKSFQEQSVKWESKQTEWIQERQLFQQQILEASKTPTESTVPSEKVQELENQNFTLSEQAKDLQIQVRNRNDQIASLQQQIANLTTEGTRSKTEFEEKTKKMKSVLQAMRTNLDQTRTKLTETEAEVEQLKTKLETESHQKQQLDGNTQHLQNEIERLQKQHSDEQELRMQAEAEAQAKVAAAERELLNFKAEFQKYKVKAAAALEGQRNDTLEAKIQELEQELLQLRSELAEKSSSLEQAESKVRDTETELAGALDRADLLESKLKEGERFRLVLEQRTKAAEDKAKVWDNEKEALQKAMNTRQEASTRQLDLLRHELERLRDMKSTEVQQKEEELKSIREISEQLSIQLEALKEESRRKDQELEQVKSRPRSSTPIRASTDKPPRVPQTPTQRKQSSGLVALQELLLGSGDASSPVPTTPPDSKRENVPVEEFNAMEKKLSFQIEQLSELLSESEKEMQRLVAQEKLLKEAVRSLEGSEKRAGMNIEYLKNIVMKFVEGTPQDRLKLIPVLNQVLVLTAEETQRIKKGLEADVSILPIKLW